MKNDDAIPLTIQLASAHLTGTPTPANELPSLLRKLHAAIMDLADPDREPRPEDGSRPAHPAAAPGLTTEERIEMSVTHDHVYCLECGKGCRLLKPHVEQAHGVSIVAYLNKWGFPPDYPLYPPAYLEMKQGMAKQQGLGTKVQASRQPRAVRSFPGGSDLKKSLSGGKAVQLELTAAADEKPRRRAPRKTG